MDQSKKRFVSLSASFAPILALSGCVETSGVLSKMSLTSKSADATVGQATMPKPTQTTKPTQNPKPPVTMQVPTTTVPVVSVPVTSSSIFCAGTSVLDNPAFYAAQLYFDVYGRVPTVAELKTTSAALKASDDLCKKTPASALNCTWDAYAAVTMTFLTSAEGIARNGALATDAAFSTVVSKIYSRSSTAVKGASDRSTYLKDALLSNAYRKNFVWDGGKCGWPIIGVNGHPLNGPTYLGGNGITIAAQIQMLKDMNLKEYRVNLQGPTDSDEIISKLENVYKIAKDQDVSILPVVFAYPRDNESFDANYKRAFETAKTIVSPFKGRIKEWELSNEIDLQIPFTGEGARGSDYDAPTARLFGAILKGLSDGVHAADPDAKRILNYAGWTHIGFFEVMQPYDIDFEIIGLHWYTNMGDMNCPGQSFPCPANPKRESVISQLKRVVPGKPIRLTEGNSWSLDLTVNPDVTPAAQDSRQRDQVYTMLMTYLHKPELYPIDRFDIYELLSEINLSSTIEAGFGIYRVKPDGSGKYTIDKGKPIVELLPLMLGNP